MGIIVLILSVLTFAAMWWLSGVDLQFQSENKKRDLIIRLVRCLATAFLLWILFASNIFRVGYGFVALIMIIPISVALIWRAPISELLSCGFHHLIDSDDKREFDPHQSARNLDKVANLLKYGRNEEAVQLCAALKESGDANVPVLETMLARAGIHQENSKKPSVLAGAHRAWLEGNFAEAEKKLVSALAENPANVNAALMLMRLYVQDLKRSDKAAEVLRALEKQPDISASQIEYAQRSIHDWGHQKQAPEVEALPESVDELLACGYLGTAIEILERKIKEQPGNFDLLLKMAEAHGLYSANIKRAEKIVKKIEDDSSFSAEQIQIAKTKLQKWRDAKTK